MAKRPPARSDDFDDIAPGRVDVRNIGAIDPRMAGSQPLFAAGSDDDPIFYWKVCRMR